MTVKRYITAVVVIFVINQITDPIIHAFILGDAYEALQHVWRPDMMSKMWVIFATSFLMALVFVFIFIKGYENKGVIEGIRFGLIVGVLMNIVGVFNQYAVYPIPASLAFQWAIFGMIQYILYGIAAGLIYRNPSNQL